MKKVMLIVPLVVLMAATLVLTGCYNGVTYYPETFSTNPLPTNLPQSLTVVNSTFSVNGVGYTEFPFSIDTLMKTPVASGSFQVKTGTVEVFILDDAGFTALKAGSPVPTLSEYYYSSAVASANINTAIDGFAGSYHLVFKNAGTQALSITANISLNWFAINSIGQR